MDYMKLSRIIWSTALCLATAVGGSLLAYAEDGVPISAGQESSTTVNNTGVSLDTPLSPGIRVIAYEDPLILSGMTGEPIQFSAEVFNDHNGYVPSSVTIISLPDESAGRLMYDSEPVSPGQSVSILTLNSLYFEPSGTGDAEFTFSADNTSLMRGVIRQRDRENSAPETSDGSVITTWTKMDTVVAGYLSGADPDGDKIRFEIVSYPSRGIVSVSDDNTGQFIYHPYEGMSGDDSFTYRMCDSYGAYSEVYTQTVGIDRAKADVYNDMQDSYYASAAHDAIKTGIMQTQNTADGENFMPYEPVSRIDFLIMTMKAMGAGEAESVSSTVFADDITLTDEEKGYLSAAYRLGIVKGTSAGGELTFSPDEAVTGAAAAVMMNGILGLSGNDSVSASAMSDSVPAWAASSVSALTGAGIIDKYTAPADDILTRENVAVILSRLMRELA